MVEVSEREDDGMMKMHARQGVKRNDMTTVFFSYRSSSNNK